MATFSDLSGIVKVGANTVAEILTATLSVEADIREDSQASDAWRTHLVGKKTWTVSCTMHWDDTDTNGQLAMAVGDSITINLYPEGDTTGDFEYSGTALIASMSVDMIKGGEGDPVGRAVELTGTGALTEGTAA